MRFWLPCAPLHVAEAPHEVSVFPLQNMLLILQLACTALFTFGASKSGLIDKLAPPSVESLKLYSCVAGEHPACSLSGSLTLRVASFLMTLTCNIMALKHVNVDTFIVVRSCMPLVVTLFDFLARSTRMPSRRSFAAMAGMVVGARGFAANVHLDRSSLLWLSAYTVAFSTDQVVIKWVCDALPLPTWDRVFLTNTLATALLFPLAMLMDLPKLEAMRNVPAGAPLMVALSCLGGVALSYTGFDLRAKVSATAFTVVGVVRHKANALCLLLIARAGVQTALHPRQRAHLEAPRKRRGRGLPARRARLQLGIRAGASPSAAHRRVWRGGG